MERRTIGAAALAVGAVGLGCMPMSWAYSGSRQRGDESVRAVHRALDLGSTLLDTADMYGPFTNELLLGRVLKERRQDAFVSTKVGLLVGEQHIVANGRPGYVRRACDASLRRLQTDVIDLYQLHREDPEVPVEETWGAMAELVQAGKVRSLGLCAMGARGGRRSGSRLYDATIRQLRRVQQVFPVSAVEAELSVWSPEALETLVPWCAERGIGFLAAMPLGNGFLTGTLTPGQGFEPDDVRARHPRFTAEMMAANQPVVSGLRRIAARHGQGVTPAQVALAWVLAQGSHVVPVPGTKHERWVTENATATSLRLTAQDLTEIRELPPAQGSWD
ncbi:aryl-alcohol dehydrogenase-like predicted oxidoreductase [Streptomyces sp. SAI-208]|uniref:aldo/keto reductase n=1 Tax=unclassified Streptomyces TaxID=2593676 RepID=UPI00247668C9|nr:MULTISPECIES: aldo/keto reductase [unclassified Streptomyces]MDH6516318.1 aryl-alcohol dehydrogenase-like predicted oxidoreductase [Streptomyces sp. SAI-090]MDH6567606.1 aryl-alcohol dehydrogenase-like predicted oxidoreductase [Streptomyces sp. SAI-117]MDH6587465.1 aryl-alcohol dehydrogenase-like predicted oxidoreductase [Streptomyces sp. SAI-133]MDH6607122.1 aryl-alcohol dehydrogenase-like predicted oxidoreductase [Streptomyces sp. SAI-208]